MCWSADGHSPTSFGVTPHTFGRFYCSSRIQRVGNKKNQCVSHFDTCLEMNLHHSAYYGKLEHVRLLLDQGADIDKGNSFGATPLYLAAWKGHLDVMQYLVEQGASLDEATTKGNWTPLICAARNDLLEVARYLLEQGADREKADEDGRTPLHYAAFQGHLEISMLLMSYGADLNARDKYGRLPNDVARTEEIKQAIRDEPRRRMDEAPGKRATEQDRHPNAATSASALQEDEAEEEQSNKRPRLDEGAVVEGEETKVAEEDEDSEPSSDEDDG